MKKNKGFTLFELLTVMSIIAILVVISAPSFKRLIQSSIISSSVNTFMSDIRFARSESIRLGGGVVMCRSNNSEVTTATCSSDANSGWEKGWIIFNDVDNIGNRLSSEPILRVQGPTIDINAISEPGATTTFKFLATGRLAGSLGSKIRFGSSPVFSSDSQRIVCVNMAGRSRIALNAKAQAKGDALCQDQ